MVAGAEGGAGAGIAARAETTAVAVSGPTILAVCAAVGSWIRKNADDLSCQKAANDPPATISTRATPVSSPAR